MDDDRHDGLIAVRVGLPALIVVVGFALMGIGGMGATGMLGLALVLIAGLVVFANVLLRFGLASTEEREDEERARERFRRSGRWT